MTPFKNGGEKLFFFAQTERTDDYPLVTSVNN